MWAEFVEILLQRENLPAFIILGINFTVLMCPFVVMSHLTLYNVVITDRSKQHHRVCSIYTICDFKHAPTVLFMGGKRTEMRSRALCEQGASLSLCVLFSTKRSFCTNKTFSEL